MNSICYTCSARNDRLPADFSRISALDHESILGLSSKIGHRSKVSGGYNSAYLSALKTSIGQAAFLGPVQGPMQIVETRDEMFGPVTPSIQNEGGCHRARVTIGSLVRQGNAAPNNSGITEFGLAQFMCS
jgi:hypothetical protein